MSNSFDDRLKDLIAYGRVILFFGAGASIGCKTKGGLTVPGTRDLISIMSREAALPVDKDPLSEVYTMAKRILGKTSTNDLLRKYFSNLIPSEDYEIVSSLPWQRIYTLNIDDGLFSALKQRSEQLIRLHTYTWNVKDIDILYENLDLIALNGYITNIDEGIIFSADEYADGLVNGHQWYARCASDFMSHTFIFIGTGLNEPLLDYHIQRLRKLGHAQGNHYLIATGLTKIKKDNLSQHNITTIDASFHEFSEWLKISFPGGIKRKQFVNLNYPQLLDMSMEQARLYENVVIVSQNMETFQPENDRGEQKNFYKGFKPTWDDIVRGIPADLEFISKLEIKIFNAKNNVIAVSGQAGCGKTTLLMQVAYKISLETKNTVYMIGQINNLNETLKDINKHHKDGITCAFIDDVDFHVDELYKYLYNENANNILFVCAARSNLWNKRIQSKIGEHYGTPLEISTITDSDAYHILHKLKEYGNMTVLGRLSPEEQVRALTKVPGRQLLIGLIEATSGRGFFDIIRSDYSSLNEDERLALLIISVINDRRIDAPINLVHSAFMTHGKPITTSFITSRLIGIVTASNSGNYLARHQVYVSRILEMADPGEIKKAITGILDAICQYGIPVYNNVNKSMYNIYKALINQDFLFRALKGNEKLILSVYSAYEKRLEGDGLFWLQYGRMYRHLHKHEKALEILEVAHSVYAMPHTIHALGHQYLICALESSDDHEIDAHVAAAINYLGNLDSFIDSDDTYPIVTLSTNHVAIIKKRGDTDEVKRLSKYYYGIMQNKIKQKPHDYELNKCAENLMREYIG
jgi:hypothetical protein